MAIQFRVFCSVVHETSLSGCVYASRVRQVRALSDVNIADLLCLIVNRTVYYGQYKCTGIGANTTGRVSWSKDLTDAQAAPFLTWDFVDGNSWIGKTA